MAKSNAAKFMDLHVEKVVLGVCVLLLMYSVAHWVVSSPREFVSACPGAPAEMRPDQVDAFLSEKATELKRVADQKVIPEAFRKRIGEALVDWAVIIDAERQSTLALTTDPALGEPMAVRVPPGGTITPIGYEMADFTKHIPAPRQPRVKSQVEMVRVMAPGLKATDKPVEKGVDTIGAYGMAVFPFGSMRDEWNRMDDIVSKTFRRVEVQVEVTGADGKATILPVESATRSPAKGAGRPVGPPEIPDYVPNKNQTTVLQAVRDWDSDVVQSRMLMPELLMVYNAEATRWVTGETNLPLPRDLTAPRRTGGAVAPMVEPRMDALPMIPVVPDPILRREDGRGEFRGGRGGLNDAPGRIEIPGRGAGDRGKAPNVRGGAGIDPRDLGGARVRPPADVPGGPGMGVGVGAGVRDAGISTGPLGVPSAKTQEATGDVYIWWQQTGLKPGTTYRYRVRLVLVNPLLAHEELIKDGKKEQALVKYVESPWSEWSEPLTVERPVRYYVTNASRLSEGQGQARVSVFGFAMGQWVHRDYNVSAGDPIGREERQELISPHTNTPVDAKVDFTTGAVAVDVLTDSPAVQPGGQIRSAPGLVLLDEEGRLKTLIGVEADKSGWIYREYERLDKMVKLAEQLRKPVRVTPRVP